MQAQWSDYLDGLQADNVVAVKFGGVAWVINNKEIYSYNLYILYQMNVSAKEVQTNRR